MIRAALCDLADPRKSVLLRRRGWFRIPDEASESQTNKHEVHFPALGRNSKKTQRKYPDPRVFVVSLRCFETKIRATDSVQGVVVILAFSGLCHWGKIPPSLRILTDMPANHLLVARKQTFYTFTKPLYRNFENERTIWDVASSLLAETCILDFFLFTRLAGANYQQTKGVSDRGKALCFSLRAHIGCPGFSFLIIVTVAVPDD